MKTAVRSTIAEAVTAGALGRWLRRKQRRALTILCYHRVLPEDRRRAYFCPDLVVTPEVFAAHVVFFSQRFDCMPLADAMAALRGGARFNRPLLSITFDDGYWDNFEFARPILEKHGVRSTFFVIASLVGSANAPWFDRLARSLEHLRTTEAKEYAGDAPDGELGRRWLQRHWRRLSSCGPSELLDAAKKLDPSTCAAVVIAAERLAAKTGWQLDSQDRVMTEGDVHKLASQGHEIGSHTRTHPILTRLDDHALDLELHGSRRELERITGRPIFSVAYPNGDHNETVIEAARRAGYCYAVTTESGLNTAKSDPLRLRRAFISQDRTSRTDGECSIRLLDLELTGVADKLFLRRLRRTEK